MERRSRISTNARAVGIAVIIAALAAWPVAQHGSRGVQAATPVYVDGAGACNGSLPCFTTIQAGVNNAGPAPAQVFVFPGSYTEDVDLSAMGSAIAGSPGTLTLTTVNASGVPADGTATLTADAADAIFNSVSPFPGAMTIEGLHVTSPDANGISLDLTGSATLNGIRAFDSFVRGVDIDAGGDVTISDSTADNNIDDGFHVEGPDVIVTDSDATDSETADGFDLSASTITISNSLAAANDGSGFELTAGETVTIDDSNASFNDSGFEIEDDGANITISISDSAASANLTEGITMDSVIGAGSSAVITRVITAENGDDGIEWIGSAFVTVTCSRIEDNVDNGVEVEDIAATDSAVNDNNIAGNGTGAATEFGTLNAEGNWWGAASGPSGSGPGTGDSVDADIDFSPFLTAPVDIENCGQSAPTATSTPSTPSSNNGGGGSNATRTPTRTATAAPAATSTAVAATATRPAGTVGSGIVAPDTGSGPAAESATLELALLAGVIGALALAGGAATLRRS